MVLEHIYPTKLIERHLLFALLLGITITIISIGIAVIIFPEDPALVAVAFTSIMLIPTINKELARQETVEADTKRYTLLSYLKKHWRLFIIYLFLFLGVFGTFAFFSIILPNIAVNHLFETQIQVKYGNVGNAIIGSSLFSGILMNNLLVLVIIFFTALLIGDGGLFLLIWNASVWGTIFAIIAKTGSLFAGKNPLLYFLLIILTVLPHMLIEATSYIMGAAAGGILSKGFTKDSFTYEQFKVILQRSFIMLFIGIIVVFLGAYVETWVLQNADTYRIIIQQSFSYLG